MKTMLRIGLCAATITAGGGAAFAKQAADYVPSFTPSGVVGVVNNGPGAGYAASLLTVECLGGTSLSPTKKRPRCPEPTRAQLAAYSVVNNKLAIKVPALKPKSKFKHKIAFFPKLKFAPGVYKFEVCADASNKVPETNETNNCKTFKKVVK